MLGKYKELVRKGLDIRTSLKKNRIFFSDLERCCSSGDETRGGKRITSWANSTSTPENTLVLEHSMSYSLKRKFY